MIKRIKNLVMAAAAVLMFSVPMLVPVMVSAQDANANIEQGLCAGANLDAGSTGSCNTNDTAATDKINGMIKLVINIFSLVVGVVSIIMIIIGGLKYITSAGDSGNVTSAKNTILYAIIGLVVVALSQFIVRFVLTKLSQQS
jgi:cytochrome bd-type quinol oxidase subunit 2